MDKLIAKAIYTYIYISIYIYIYIYIYMISLEREGASRKSLILDNRVQSLDIFDVKILPFKFFLAVLVDFNLMIWLHIIF